MNEGIKKATVEASDLVKVIFDPMCFQEKPKDTGALRNRMKKAPVEDLTLKEIRRRLLCGRSIMPRVNQEGRKEAWKEQQLVFVDIDNAETVLDDAGNPMKDENGKVIERCVPDPMTPDEAETVLKANGITPCLMYQSFNSRPDWFRFRVVVRLSKAITDPDEMVDLEKRLSSLFRHYDPKCAGDLARLFYGTTGDKLITFDDESQVDPDVVKAIPLKEAEKPKKEPKKEQIVTTTPKPENRRVSVVMLEDLKKRLNDDIHNFDLAGYVEDRFGSVKVGGFYNPCPVCGHNDDFTVDGAVWTCFSSSNTSGIEGGTIIDLLMAVGGLDQGQALEQFKFDIMGYDRREWKLANAQADFEEITKRTVERREPILEFGTKGQILQTIGNAEEAIRYDAQLYGHIKYNELSQSQCVFGTLPWKADPLYREWKDTDDAHLLSYLERRYGITSKDKVMTALAVVSDDNKVNPVCDALNVIRGKWDGKTGHIRQLLPKYLLCDDTEYNYEVMKVFMLGAIKRAFQPGCKFDYMLVIVGKQGGGKSTFLQRLALKDEWYNDNLNTIEGDTAFEKLRGSWIAEIQELLATKRAKDVESIKAFITSRYDKFRKKYGRVAEQHPRRCVFAGTTNDDSFLSDRTGNRRFLPIRANGDTISAQKLFTPGAKDDFCQAWAEAMDLYLKNPDVDLVLPQSVKAEWENALEEHTEEDPRVGLIQNWLDRVTADRVCVEQITDAVFLSGDSLGNYRKATPEYKRLTSDVNMIMKTQVEGWAKYPKRVYISGYGQKRNVYTRTEPKKTEETVECDDLM